MLSNGPTRCKGDAEEVPDVNVDDAVADVLPGQLGALRAGFPLPNLPRPQAGWTGAVSPPPRPERPAAAHPDGLPDDADFYAPFPEAALRLALPRRAAHRAADSGERAHPRRDAVGLRDDAGRASAHALRHPRPIHCGD